MGKFKKKKKTSIAFSSIKNEYMALSKALAKVIWLKQLLQEIGFQQIESTTFHSNSWSVITLNANPKFHSQSKHYHFTWERL